MGRSDKDMLDTVKKPRRRHGLNALAFMQSALLQ
jgi:hypothetical protein